MWWKKHKDKVLMAGLALVLLAAVFWYGGSAPGMQGWSVEQSQPEETTVSAPEEPTTQEEPVSADEAENPPQETEEQPVEEEGDETWSELQGMTIDSSTGKDAYQTAPVPEGRPVPVEPEETTISDVAYTCTLTVRCDTVLDNMDWLDPAKHELIPEDGVLFPETTVTFYEGESVFNVLQREMKKAGIHLEFTNVPVYNSAYIEGIGNLYEYDCGELSGWIYRVNDWFPNYGCSRYQLQQGDAIQWIYTCKLGADVEGRTAVTGS